MKRALTVLAVLVAFTIALRAGSKEIVICHYNVENYVDTKPAGEGSRYGSREKSPKAVGALISIIKTVNPDILGVCEMGSPERFEEFKKRLAEAGMGYSDSEYVQSADPDRHLALVSRFPIVSRQSAVDVSFELNGKREKVRRGFLDVTIQVNPDYRLRMVGVHLSRRARRSSGASRRRRCASTSTRSSPPIRRRTSCATATSMTTRTSRCSPR
jgi:hypothetical protein